MKNDEPRQTRMGMNPPSTTLSGSLVSEAWAHELGDIENVSC